MARLDQIRKVLRQEDIEGLIAAGAPDYEYDYEAEEIEEAMQALESAQGARALTPDAVAGLIRNIWQEWFELDDAALNSREKTFRRLAELCLKKPAKAKKANEET